MDNPNCMMDESEDAASETAISNEIDADYDIGYVAGIRMTAHGAAYKIVWCKRDVAFGEARFEWAKLARVVELGSKVLEFHRRWHIKEASSLPVGFMWEHELPVCSRRKWKCPVGGCNYITEKESNCRQHIGSVHSQTKIQCGICGVRQSTHSNLRKHVKNFHATSGSD
jgi:hypothetical protein